MVPRVVPKFERPDTEISPRRPAIEAALQEPVPKSFSWNPQSFKPDHTRPVSKSLRNSLLQIDYVAIITLEEGPSGDLSRLLEAMQVICSM